MRNSSGLLTEVIGSEVRFCIPFGNHLLSGIIDNLLYDKSQDILLICDLKKNGCSSQQGQSSRLSPVHKLRLGDTQRRVLDGYPPEIDRSIGVSGGSERLEQFRDTETSRRLV